MLLLGIDTPMSFILDWRIGEQLANLRKLYNSENLVSNFKPQFHAKGHKFDLSLIRSKVNLSSSFEQTW